jgi:hypothetical protein
MIHTECDAARCAGTHIRCAKRSSAALRTAVQLEEEMQEKEVELMPANAEAVRRILRQPKGAASSSDSGVAARVRRDAKNALEQRVSALACGEQPMLSISIVGRALRIWGDWYALCSLCGAMLRVHPHNRFGSEICCLRCDAKMLGIDPPEAANKRSAVCRYCGASDPERSGARWKLVKAPLDFAGPNRDLPPPLRTVHYCPQHWRSWLGTAHRSLPTRVILCHLAHNAKPVFGAEVGKRPPDAELGFEPVASKKRRRGRGSR